MFSASMLLVMISERPPCTGPRWKVLLKTARASVFNELKSKVLLAYFLGILARLRYFGNELEGLEECELQCIKE